MDWLDLLAVQGTLKSLLQHHSSKASILRRSAFITVQLSHPCMTTGKTIALTRQTFVGKVMCLLFNMLSRLIITFLPRSKRLLISWLQSQFAVILEPRKIKSATVSTVSPSITKWSILKSDWEKAMAPYSSTLAWKTPWTEEPGWLQSMGSQRVRHEWATSLSLFTYTHWRRKWQPTPVFLPGESQGRGCLVGCCLWGCTESDTTEAT